MSEKSLITVLYDQGININELKQKLEKTNQFTLLNNDTLEIEDGRKIHIDTYYQLKKKAPNSPYIHILYTKILELKIEEIENSDVVLFYNVNQENTSKLMYFYIAITWYLNKTSKYFWADINRHNPFYNEIFPLNIPSLKEDISNIVPPPKINNLKNPNLIVEKEPVIIPKKTTLKKLKLK